MLRAAWRHFGGSLLASLAGLALAAPLAKNGYGQYLLGLIR